MCVCVMWDVCVCVCPVHVRREFLGAPRHPSYPASLLQASTKTDDARQTSAALAQEKSRTEALEREYLVRKKTLEMLPESSKFIAQLQQICSAT